MPWEIKKVDEETKKWFQHPFVWVAAGLLLCGVLLVAPRAKAYYQQWGERRHVWRAMSNYNRREFKQAILEAKGVLEINPKNVEAARIIAKSLEALDEPGAAQLRGHLDSVSKGDAENQLAMVKAALKSGDLAAAERMLAEVAPTGQKSARYHDLAAELARRRQDFAGADAQWAEAVKLEPGEDDYKLKLGSLRLTASDTAVRANGLELLKDVIRRPAKRPDALRALLADAVWNGERERVEELAKALGAEPQAAFVDKLAQLAALRAIHSPEFDAVLAQMQDAAVANPYDVYRLLIWMNENDLALLVPAWAAKLPPAMVATPPVCVPVADADARASAWEKLRTELEGASWKEFEFLRFAYLARALERLGDPGGAGVAWDKSVSAAVGRPEMLEALGKTVLAWGWKQRAEEALWKLAGAKTCPTWVASFLWKASQDRGDAVHLYHASRLLLKADPKSVSARNNFITLSLLTGQTADSPHVLAAGLYQEYPADPVVVSTYGLSLHQQGKSAEAVAILAKLSPDELHNPLVALYFGVFLAAAGKTDQAAGFLELGAGAPQLPEERAMSEYLRLAFQARAADQAGDQKSAARLWGQALETPSAPEAPENLARIAQSWGWKERANAALLSMAAAGRCPLWAATPLWSAALGAGDSSSIYKTSALILKADPKSLAARNRFIRVALWTRHLEDQPQQLAEALHREYPAELPVADTLGLAWLQQGKVEKAVELTGATIVGRSREASSALYAGIFVAASGRAQMAEALLLAGAPAAELPEEKMLLSVLRLALEAHRLAGDGSTPAEETWSKAITAAQARPDWLELLGAMAIKMEDVKFAERALWRRADEPDCPLWVSDFLWSAALKSGTSAERVKASKLRVKAAPEDLAVRVDQATLALLYGANDDSGERMAQELYSVHPEDVRAIATWALSLHLGGRNEEACGLLAGLKPEQIRDPRASYYYGLFLTAKGLPAEAAKYLERGAAASLLPEEKALAQKVKPPTQARAALPGR